MNKKKHIRKLVLTNQQLVKTRDHLHVKITKFFTTFFRIWYRYMDIYKKKFNLIL